MGLDMYLFAKRFVSFASDRDIRQKLKLIFPELHEDHVINHVTSTVAVWRKANAIHKWFVDNVQRGQDDCGTYDVTRDQLRQLLVTVESVLESPEKAPELLPCAEGFFFGPTEYDAFYFQDVKYTQEVLQIALAPDMNDWHFSYYSSW